MADNIPSLKILGNFAGKVVSEAFPKDFQEPDPRGGWRVKGAGWIYNVSVPLIDEPDRIIQVHSAEKPKIGDSIEFQLQVSVPFRAKYAVKSVVLKGSKNV